MANNYKVKIIDLQNKYKFKIFTSGGKYDDSELKHKVDSIYQAFPKATATGTDANLTGTAAALMNIDLKGNTSQYTTTGKNLFDKNHYNAGKGVSTSTGGLYNSDTSFATDYIPITPNTYIVNAFSSVANRVYGAIYDANKQYLGEISSGSGTYNFTITNENAKYMRLTAINEYLNTYQIEKGSTATDYEPYTGGVASPNPSYPQDVNVVSGDNTITIANSDDTESQSYNVNLGTLELCKIGDYQDYIYKENGSWYLHKEIGKVVITGASSETWSNDTTYNRFTSSNALNGFRIDVRTLSLCTCYKYGDSSQNYYFALASNGTTSLFNKPSGVSSVDEWRTWLSANKPIVYYVLATPTNTLIEDTTLREQLEALRNAESYEGQTNISQTNNDLPFIITASAIKDLSNL